MDDRKQWEGEFDEQFIDKDDDVDMSLFLIRIKDFIRDHQDKRSKEMSRLQKSKDQAYWERNQLVATLSKMLPAYLERHPEQDIEWEDDWRNIVCIEVPYEDFANSHDPSFNYSDRKVFVATWHIHDSDLPNFSHLTMRDTNSWDGHTTEEKYNRISRYLRED